MLFTARERGALLMVPRPLLGSQIKGLFADVSFVSVLVMVLSENGKPLEEIFFIIFVILRYRGNNLFSKIFLQSFSIF